MVPGKAALSMLMRIYAILTIVTSHPSHLASPPQTPPSILSLDLNNLADDISSILVCFQINNRFAQSQNRFANLQVIFCPD